MNKNLILVGLPGSGKTTFAEEYCIKNNSKYGSPKARHIEIDKIKESRWTKYKDTEDIIRRNIDKRAINIIDGLFLTNNDIIRVINCAPSFYVEIHFWEPDIEKCLHNDVGRRKQNSIMTIKNTKIETPDLKRIKGETGNEDITIIKHEIVEKPFWKVKADEMDVYVRDGKYIYSDEWNMGGSHGNCWDSTQYPVSGDEPVDFTQFDSLLEKICPNITFLQYKIIYKQCVETDNRYESDYYGGGVTYGYYKCDLEKLFGMLEERGLLNR